MFFRGIGLLKLFCFIFRWESSKFECISTNVFPNVFPWMCFCECVSNLLLVEKVVNTVVWHKYIQTCTYVYMHAYRCISIYTYRCIPIKVFQIVVRGGSIPPIVGEIRNFAGEIFYRVGGRNLRRSDFDRLTFFKAKIKISRTCMSKAKSMELKPKWYWSNGYTEKWSLLQGYNNLKIGISGGN